MSPEFGEAVRAARNQRELSQDELALATGLHRTHISLIERGKREPTLETLVRLSRGLGVPLGDLVSWHVPSTAYARDATQAEER